MPLNAASFELHPAEKILYQSHPNRQWYALAWKLLISLLEVGLVSFVLAALLQQPAAGFLAKFLPVSVATLLAQIIFFGLFPLLILLWAAEDFATQITSEFVLTDQRVWIKGAPYAWSQGEIPLPDVGTMTSRRDAVFIQTRSDRKVHVLMISDCKPFVKAYYQFLGKEPPGRGKR